MTVRSATVHTAAQDDTAALERAVQDPQGITRSAGGDIICAKVAAGSTTVYVSESLGAIERIIRAEVLTRLAVIAAAGLALALLLNIVLHRHLVRPLQDMAGAVRRFAAGEHGVQMADPDSMELGLIAREFNLMSAAFKRIEDERARAEKALAESAKGLRDIFEKAADGILITDLDGKKFYGCNPTICQMLGYTPEEIVTLGLPDIHPAKDLPDVMDQFQKQGKKEFALARDLPMMRKDGTVFYADVSAVPMTLRGRECLAGFFRDVTDRKLAQEKLKLYTADLERANEEVKQFAYIVSHDFRAPLVNLKGFAGEIRSSLRAVASALEAALPHLSEKQRKAAVAALQTNVPEALHFIETAASNMDNYVNALLKFSRLGRQELHPERLRVAEIVERSLKGLAHQISERGVTVSVGPLPEVVADRTALEQIMGNLLTNAVLYLEPGRPGRIEVGGSCGPDETTFFVRDNGRDIAQADMPKVFAPFRRAGKQDVKGEGMGMAYVRTLVRRHGGEIRCESQFGVGTTFTFTIRNSIEKEKHDAHTATS